MKIWDKTCLGNWIDIDKVHYFHIEKCISTEKWQIVAHINAEAYLFLTAETQEAAHLKMEATIDWLKYKSLDR